MELKIRFEKPVFVELKPGAKSCTLQKELFIVPGVVFGGIF